jgi:hypothetical protein
VRRGGGDSAAAPLELSQETEQEAESGDIDQSFEVSSSLIYMIPAPHTWSRREEPIARGEFSRVT